MDHVTSTPPSTSSPSPSYSVRGVMGRRVYAERAKKLGVLDLGAKRRIELGHAGPDVQELQRFLGEEGYATVPDGYFGQGTKRALELWQRDAGVRATGAFDAASKERYLRFHESAVSRAIVSKGVRGAGGGAVEMAAVVAVVAVVAAVAVALRRTPKDMSLEEGRWSS